MKKKYRAFALFSGGLDSILSVLWMKKIGVEIIPIFFKTAFFGPETALEIAKKSKINLTIIDITEEHMQMVLNPKYGYGKNLNPCIDCHGMMFREAAKRMKEYEVDFIVSGEVLAQRPMSQRKNSLNSVSKLSGIKDLIIRPLSQKLLPDTLPIREGWIRKDDMLDFQGRTRQRQLQLAKKFSITEFPNSGGGCSLTDVSFSARLKDLIEYNMYEVHKIDFLKFGRHFRLNNNTKLIIGRNKSENDSIAKLCDKTDLVLKAADISGPLGIIQYKKFPDTNEITLAAEILLRYNLKVKEKIKIVYGVKFELSNEISAGPIMESEANKYLILRKLNKNGK
jgi:tRNA U34 2-thiouridine synthase MnmA/TrmU